MAKQIPADLFPDVFVVETERANVPSSIGYELLHQLQKSLPRGSMTRAFPWLELDDDRKTTLPMGKMVSWFNFNRGDSGG